jgi:hypothetical protein
MSPGCRPIWAAGPEPTLVTITPWAKESMPSSWATAGDRLATVAPVKGLRPAISCSSRAGLVGGGSVLTARVATLPAWRTPRFTLSPGRRVPMA